MSVLQNHGARSRSYTACTVCLFALCFKLSFTSAMLAFLSRSRSVAYAPSTSTFAWYRATQHSGWPGYHRLYGLHEVPSRPGPRSIPPAVAGAIGARLRLWRASSEDRRCGRSKPCEWCYRAPQQRRGRLVTPHRRACGAPLRSRCPGTWLWERWLPAVPAVIQAHAGQAWRETMHMVAHEAAHDTYISVRGLRGECGFQVANACVLLLHSPQQRTERKANDAGYVAPFAIALLQITEHQHVARQRVHCNQHTDSQARTIERRQQPAGVTFSEMFKFQLSSTLFRHRIINFVGSTLLNPVCLSFGVHPLIPRHRCLALAPPATRAFLATLSPG